MRKRSSGHQCNSNSNSNSDINTGIKSTDNANTSDSNDNKKSCGKVSFMSKNIMSLRSVSSGSNSRSSSSSIMISNSSSSDSKNNGASGDDIGSSSFATSRSGDEFLDHPAAHSLQGGRETFQNRSEEEKEQNNQTSNSNNSSSSSSNDLDSWQGNYISLRHQFTQYSGRDGYVRPTWSICWCRICHWINSSNHCSFLFHYGFTFIGNQCTNCSASSSK